MKTESIRYAGSKAKILEKIFSLTKKIKANKILDGFSGSTRVSQMFKRNNFLIHSNDLAYYSKILGECYLLNTKPKKYYEPIIKHLNNLNPINGWFSDIYGGYENNGLSVQEDGKKRLLQIKNSKKLDAIREEIDKEYKSESIEKSVLLTSLLLSLDKVTNDLGHQVSYLREWASKSYNDLMLEVPNLLIDDKPHKVFNKDIFDIKEEYDLAYLDPPYGTANLKTLTSRVRYFSYYHFWTTVCKNDKPNVFGKSNRREDVSSDKKPGAISIFENTNLDIVKKAFLDLIKSIKSKYFIISYSNRSKVPISDLISIIENNFCIIEILSFEHAENSQANSLKNGKYKTNYQDKNLEFLILLEK